MVRLLGRQRRGARRGPVDTRGRVEASPGVLVRHPPRRLGSPALLQHCCAQTSTPSGCHSRVSPPPESRESQIPPKPQSCLAVLSDNPPAPPTQVPPRGPARRKRRRIGSPSGPGSLRALKLRPPRASTSRKSRSQPPRTTRPIPTTLPGMRSLATRMKTPLGPAPARIPTKLLMTTHTPPTTTLPPGRGVARKRQPA